MFSSQVLDHFQNPRNAGDLQGATASVEVNNPVCGDVLQLAIKVEQGRITRASFRCRGCTTSIACASQLTVLLSGNFLSGFAKFRSTSWHNRSADYRLRRFTARIWPSTPRALLLRKSNSEKSSRQIKTACFLT
jgi:hypothetical protein